jgi:hypothetical protein
VFNPFDLDNKLTGVKIPRFGMPGIQLPENYKLADTFYDQLRRNIEQLQKSLKKKEQLLIYFYTSPNEPILVTSIGFQNPYMMIFHGIDAMGNECAVLSHMLSVQLILRVVKIEDRKKKRRIGFLQ